MRDLFACYEQATSYSTLRRQVRSQVRDDLCSLAADDSNVHGNSEDESVDQILATNAVPSVALTELINKTHADSVCYPLNVDNSGGSGDDIAGDNDSPPQCNSYGSDFADCHWIDSDTDSEDTDRDEEANVVGQINEWANKYAIPHAAVKDLMQILKPYLPALSGCARTLLSTPRACSVKQLKSGGEYCHLGLAKGLQEMHLYGTAVQTKCLVTIERRWCAAFQKLKFDSLAYTLRAKKC